MRWTPSLLGLGLLLVSRPREAAAQAQPSPFEVNAPVELPVLVAVGVGAMLPRVFYDELGPPSCRPDCDPNRVNELDRWVIGNHSDVAVVVSDAAFYGSLAAPFTLSALDFAFGDAPDGVEGYLEDNLVLGETMMFTLAAANVTQFVFARPRPLVYDDVNFTEEERFGSAHMLSFPAGHVAGGVALATTYGWIFTRRHPNSPWIVPIWVAGYSVAALNGAGRIAAGEHFLTDTIVGAVMGAGIGIAVPLAHERSHEPPRGALLPRLRVGPMALPTGAGLMVSAY